LSLTTELLDILIMLCYPCFFLHHNQTYPNDLNQI